MALVVKKTMVFAAGRGERLRPLTDKTPKALLPIGDRSVIEYGLFFLKRHGIEEVVINTHHNGHQIPPKLEPSSRYGLKINYSVEPELMGTGGGLKKTESHFKSEKAFVTINSDILIDVDLSEVIACHERWNATATMVLKGLSPKDVFTPIQMRDHSVTSIGISGAHFFTGLMILSPEIFEVLPAGQKSCLVTDGVKKLIAQGKMITGFIHNGYWRDIGTPQSYEAAQQEWAATHFQRQA